MNSPEASTIQCLRTSFGLHDPSGAALLPFPSRIESRTRYRFSGSKGISPAGWNSSVIPNPVE